MAKETTTMQGKRAATYEELPMAEKVKVLEEQNKHLIEQGRQMLEELKFKNKQELFARLEWLWKVITLEGSEEVFGEAFFKACTEEFKVLMTPVDKEQPTEPAEE